MLRTWIEDVIGRLTLLGSNADGLEDENRKLQAELAGLRSPARKRRHVRALAARQQVGTLARSCRDGIMYLSFRDSRLPIAELLLHKFLSPPHLIWVF
jgi:hypothetical protein